MILISCLVKLSFLIFIRMFDKTDIQWSSEVSHKKLISKKCKKNVLLAKVKLFVMMLVHFFTDPVSSETLAEVCNRYIHN